tara:strand:- start:790 stop:936 length:147 start_codon:yes stop_codon:yes gene_type:complete
MKQFTTDVVQLWVKWNQDYHCKEIDNQEAERQLQLLKDLISALKNYPR